MTDADFRAVLQTLGRSASTPTQTPPVASTVAVLGAGAVGRALACAALAAGAEVRLHSVYGRELDDLRTAGAITVRGADLIGSYGVAAEQVHRPHIRLTASVDEAVAGADVILLATPATAHPTYAGLLADCLEPGQQVVLVPGRFLGSAAFRSAMAAHRPVTGIVVAELCAAPYLATTNGAGVHLHGVARRVGLASLPVAAAPQVVATLADLLPMLEPVADPLVTAFGSMTGIVGVAPRLTNTALVEAHAGQPTLLRDLVPAGLSRTLLRQLDDERRTVAFHYGVRELPTAAGWLRGTFGADADQVADRASEPDDIAAALADLEVFDEVHLGADAGPGVVDDVSNLLVPTADAARLAGVDVPATDTVIRLASCLVGRDLAATGRTLAGVGLAADTPDGVRRALGQTGSHPEPDPIYWSV